MTYSPLPKNLLAHRIVCTDCHPFAVKITGDFDVFLEESLVGVHFTHRNYLLHLKLKSKRLVSVSEAIFVVKQSLFFNLAILEKLKFRFFKISGYENLGILVVEI